MEENKDIESDNPGEKIPEVEHSEMRPSSESTTPFEDNILPKEEANTTNEQSSTINSQLSTEQEMEVHHHTHAAHGKKNWKSYFWEFLMLFLAVFCGFLAEYKLEQTIERHREMEFIISMIEDAAADTANINEAIPLNLTRAAYADSLAIACINYQGKQNENTTIYKAHRNSIYRPDLVYPSERTLFQLKNSGGMRLIRKKKAAESIMAYDNSGKKLVNQQSYYEMYLTNATEASAKMMIFLEFWGNNKTNNDFEFVKLINADETNLLALSNNAVIFKGVLLQYINRLREMKEQAVLLINNLKQEYRL